MSLIIAIKKENTFYVGCDTRITDGASYRDSYYQCPKAFFVDVNKGLIVSWAGLHVIGDIAASILRKHDIKSLSKEYIVDFFWPEFYERCNVTTATRNGYIDGELMLIMNDAGYVIDSAGGVVEIRDKASIGSGSEIAYGIMQAIPKYKELSVEALIINAIEGAASVRNDISSEVYIANTRNKVFKQKVLVK